MNSLNLTHEDNIDSVPELKETVRDWLENITHPFESYATQIEELEYKRRDGFIPHSWNNGGLDLILISDIGGLVGSGEHFGLSIESWVDGHYNEACENAIKEGLVDGSDDYYEHVDANTRSEYDAVAYRIRVMYEGEGVLKVYAGYDKDAPYFRWNSKDEFETEINFKTISGLKRQLKALTKKVEAAQ